MRCVTSHSNWGQRELLEIEILTHLLVGRILSPRICQVGRCSVLMLDDLSCRLQGFLPYPQVVWQMPCYQQKRICSSVTHFEKRRQRVCDLWAAAEMPEICQMILIFPVEVPERIFPAPSFGMGSMGTPTTPWHRLKERKGRRTGKCGLVNFPFGEFKHQLQMVVKDCSRWYLLEFGDV